MKINKPALALFGLLALSATANVFYTENQFSRDRALDACAKEQNVYACKWVAQPVEAPRVVTVQAALLPFPEELGGAR